MIAVKKLTITIGNISLNNLKYFLKYCIKYNKKLILLLINIEIYKAYLIEDVTIRVYK
jgi:hypothetical protein